MISMCAACGRTIFIGEDTNNQFLCSGWIERFQAVNALFNLIELLDGRISIGADALSAAGGMNVRTC